MSNKADDHNPLLSTPVATIAVDLFKAQMARAPRPSDEILHIANGCVSAAQAIVGALHEHRHLPLTIETEDEPKVDDATLFAQAMVFLGARWETFGPGDPRGEVCVNGIRYSTKAVKGVPAIPNELRRDLIEALAPHLRKL